MKAKDIIDEILLKDSNSRIEIKNIDKYSEKSKSNLTIATLLSWLTGFSYLLIEARINIGIEPKFGIRHLICLPNPANEKSVLAIKIPLYPKQLKQLSTEAMEILKYYNLSSNWFISIRLAILTNFLYLPPKLEPIIFVENRAPQSYPAISINSKVSIHKLRLFIQENSDIIREIVNKLSNSRARRVSDDTFLWGKVVAIMVRDVPLAKVDSVFAVIKSKLDEVFEETDMLVPEAYELRRTYERFLKYVNQLQPGLTMKLPKPPES